MKYKGRELNPIPIIAWRLIWMVPIYIVKAILFICIIVGFGLKDTKDPTDMT